MEDGSSSTKSNLDSASSAMGDGEDDESSRR
jgi:hypothetical protein